ncbi:MAG: inositol monophosphatase [Rhodospirillales bacterium]|nr:inositol monophosphatase [Rhodospirillales bacterium]
MDINALRSRFDFAHQVIRDAGAHANGYFRDLSQLNIESKGLQDMASQADIETEQLILGQVGERFPEDAFFGEESGGIAPKAGQGVWVVDPIDGTAPFVKGIPVWCVSIAFMVDGRLQFGLIYDPTHDELFSALHGHGAHLNGRKITPDPSTSIQDGRFCIGFSHRTSPASVTTVLHAHLEAGGMYTCLGSGALGLVYVACGRYIGYYEAHINSWDCYGAVAILREAGAHVVEAEAGNGLTEGCEIIATTPGVTEAFAEILEKARTTG